MFALITFLSLAVMALSVVLIWLSYLAHTPLVSFIAVLIFFISAFLALTGYLLMQEEHQKMEV